MPTMETRSARRARLSIACLNSGLLEDVVRLASGLPAYVEYIPPNLPPPPQFDMLAAEDWESRRAIHREIIIDGMRLLWHFALVSKEWAAIARTVSRGYTRLSADRNTAYVQEPEANALIQRGASAGGLHVEASYPREEFYHLLSRILSSSECLETLDISFRRHPFRVHDDLDPAYFIRRAMRKVGRECPLRRLVWDFGTSDAIGALCHGSFAHLAILDITSAVELPFVNVAQHALTLPTLHTLRVNQQAQTNSNVLLALCEANFPSLLSFTLRSRRWELLLAVVLDRFEDTLIHCVIEVPFRRRQPGAGERLLSMSSLERLLVPSTVAWHRMGGEYVSLASLVFTDLSFACMFNATGRRRAVKALKEFSAHLDDTDKLRYPSLTEIRLRGSSFRFFKHVKWSEEEKRDLTLVRFHLLRQNVRLLDHDGESLLQLLYKLKLRRRF